MHITYSDSKTHIFVNDNSYVNVSNNDILFLSTSMFLIVLLAPGFWNSTPNPTLSFPSFLCKSLRFGTHLVHLAVTSPELPFSASTSI